MNYRTERLGKVKRGFGFSLLLISIILVFNFGLLSAGGEGDAEMLAFNISASGFKLDEGYPRPRVFTPNGDGNNEQVTFEYENIDENSIVCWIYDIRGSVVRQLDIVGSGDEFTWDGKDEDGNIAPSGIYIYQIEVEGQTINGTIVLAK
jgi:gliding motility-associated-like protein